VEVDFLITKPECLPSIAVRNHLHAEYSTIKLTGRAGILHGKDKVIQMRNYHPLKVKTFRFG
jgi:hypothetical protein